MTDISIIILAYNPDFHVFERCLVAIQRLKKENITVEYLLIDNNSIPALKENEIVRSFLSKNSEARVIIEKRQGCGYARICGFQHSKAPIIVSFDDDNEPEENYLLSIVDYIKRNPQVGVFGPGRVEVKYIDGAKKYFNKYKQVFQELDLVKEQSGTSTSRYHEYYPYGTGMVIRKTIADKYSDEVENGRLTSIGRKEGSMASCDDLQIVWFCLKEMGYAAGRTPLLKVNHLINAKKANFKYWKRLTYGGAFSWLPARFEVFPEEKLTVKNTGLEIRKSILRICKVFVYNFYKPRFLIISVIGQVGILHSIYQINNKKPPKVLTMLKKILVN